MSDSRFHLSVSFEVYGEKFEWKPSLNWSANPGECDERISGWFAECYERAYFKFQEFNVCSKQDADRKHDLAELARLREKYPND